MRLDSYLVKTGILGSRERAKRAIAEGYVKVNDRVITKVSHDIAYSDRIEITGGLDKPAGYWKLKGIQEKTGLIRAGDRVLDIGSSAGGFLLFASEIAYSVHGIEFSSDFYSELQKIAHEHPNVTVESADVFKKQFEKEKFDILLLDITAIPHASVKALENVIVALKKRGMLLHVLKFPKEKEIAQVLEKYSSLGLQIIRILESEKKEAYIIARKL